MNTENFILLPFPTIQTPPNLKIMVAIALSAHQLTIDYHVLGNLAQIELAPLSDQPVRKNQLWENTCFEFFLGLNNSPIYWEFNLSSAGHWNIYRFNNYRQGMQEELAFTSLPFTVKIEPEALFLSLKLDLDAIISADQSLEVGVTTVIKDKQGEVTYWALTHTGLEADFHRRDSFIIKLP